MSSFNKRGKGSEKELYAIRYLADRGYRILEHGFFTRQGEIDIICTKERTLVFAEVKYRSSDRAGLPEEAVNPKKIRRICRAADYYLYTHRMYADYRVRFDVIAILKERITHYEDAFPYMGPI